jgi:hypothetical protein
MIEDSPYCIKCNILTNGNECSLCRSHIHTIKYYIEHNIIPKDYFNLSMFEQKVIRKKIIKGED